LRGKLKERRVQLGFTHEEVAKMAEIDRTTYTNIELGRKNPSLPVALKIKKALQTESDDIFCLQGVKREQMVQKLGPVEGGESNVKCTL
jgi:putative transcriptional regulator